MKAPRTSAESTRTVRRATHKLRILTAMPATRPWVSDANMVKRVAWAEERQSWGDKWGCAFFTDESSFEVKLPSRARVWWFVDKRLRPWFLRPSFKSGRQTLMVWAGFSARGRTPLRHVSGSKNTDQYEEVLAEDIFYYIVADYGAPDAAWLRQDMAPCLASKSSKAAKVSLWLKPLPWMRQSPDINPIENVRNELDRRLGPPPPRTWKSCGGRCGRSGMASPMRSLTPFYSPCPAV